MRLLTYWHVQEQRCCSTTQVMDFGYPQFTEAKILSEYIKTDAHKMEVRACLVAGVSTMQGLLMAGIYCADHAVRSCQQH